MRNILITGGSGVIGSYLNTKLTHKGYNVKILSRNKTKNYYVWNIQNNFIEKKALNNINIIIHLAGESIISKRWNPYSKYNILTSRINGINLLYKYIYKYNVKVRLFITISGINNNDKNDSFIKKVNYEILNSTNKFKNINIRVINIQTGLVLCKNNPIIKKSLLSMNKYHIGCYFGNNSNYIPWIHIYDLYKYFLHIIKDTKIAGNIKVASPDKITIKNIISSLKMHMKKKIFLFKIPVILIYIIYGDVIKIFLYKYYIPQHTLIKLKYFKLNKAIENILKNKI